MKKLLEKVKNNGFIKKVGALTIASAIGAASAFGLAGCILHQQPETNAVSQNNQSTEELRGIVNSLIGIVENMEGCDDIRNKLFAVESRLTDIENNNECQDELIAELFELVDEIKNEIAEINVKLEQSGEDENKKNRSDLAKIEAKLAIESCVNSYYTCVDYGNAQIYSSPNGDVVGAGENNQCFYYNKENDLTFMRYEEEEILGPGLSSLLNTKEIMNQYLEDEGFVLIQEENANNEYVFANEEGATITISIDGGVMTNLDLQTLNGEGNCCFSRRDKESFEYALLQCKSVLKSIGVFEDYKRELNNAFDFKYGEILMDSSVPGNVATVKGVYYRDKLALEQKANGSVAYSVEEDDKSYTCYFDENGNKTEERSGEKTSVNLSESFKYSFSGWIFSGGASKIVYDEENERYIITSQNEGYEQEVLIKFNEDFSVECKTSVLHNDSIEKEIVTYKINKITKERYKEIFQKINDICEDAKQQENSLLQ